MGGGVHRVGEIKRVSGVFGQLSFDIRCVRGGRLMSSGLDAV